MTVLWVSQHCLFNCI